MIQKSLYTNTHILCLEEALTKKGLSYSVIPDRPFCVAVEMHGMQHFFVANHMPLNSGDVIRITKDKGLTYDLLHPYLRLPRTMSYVDPQAPEPYVPYIRHKSLREISAQIQSTFTYPLVIKKNSGSQGKHVFLCHDVDQVTNSLNEIYAKGPDYDHVALAQEAIQIAREFRVTVLGGEICLVYEKDISHASFVGNLSPLHWQNARAKSIHRDQESQLWEQLRTFIAPLFTLLNLEYGGLDICIDATGNLVLFEINSQPAYNYLVAAEGEAVLVTLYERVLQYLQDKR